MHGFTGNYVKVRTPFNAELINQIIKVKIIEVNEDDTCSVDF